MLQESDWQRISAHISSWDQTQTSLIMTVYSICTIPSMKDVKAVNTISC